MFEAALVQLAQRRLCGTTASQRDPLVHLCKGLNWCQSACTPCAPLLSDRQPCLWLEWKPEKQHPCQWSSSLLTYVINYPRLTSPKVASVSRLGLHPSLAGHYDCEGHVVRLAERGPRPLSFSVPPHISLAMPGTPLFSLLDRE